MCYSVKFIKSGNLKLGQIWTFNKLAGNGIINGCMGSCGNCCQGCYNSDNPKKSDCFVFKSYVQYGWDRSTVVKSHIKNTIAIRTNIIKAFSDIDLQIKRAKKQPSIIRIHSSGELEKSIELKYWIWTAQNNPTIKFYIYTKNYSVLDDVLTNIEKLPDNFFINVSIWHDNGIDIYKKYQNINNIKCFVYDDKLYNYQKSGIQLKTYCPAYDTKGKLSHNLTCDKCGICFNNNVKVCGCYAH